MRRREIDRMVRKIAKYLGTPEGKASLKRAREDAERFCAEMRRKRHVDPLSMFERVTI